MYFRAATRLSKSIQAIEYSQYKEPMRKPHQCAPQTGRILLRSFFKTAVLCLVAGLFLQACIAVASAQDDAQNGGGQISAFQVFELQRTMRLLGQALRDQRFGAAERLLRQTIEQGHDFPSLHYSLAVALLLQGKKAAALDSLETAVKGGYGSAEVLSADPRLQALKSDPRFAELVEQARGPRPTTDLQIAKTVPPSIVEDGIAEVSVNNTIWIPQPGVLRSLFAFDTENPSGAKVQTGQGRAAALLNQWFEQGRAAGNYGDLYDNRDRNHSSLKLRRLPQMSAVKYSDAARALNLDYGSNTDLFFNATTVGNSSLAVTRKQLWRSLPRAILSEPARVTKLHLQYRNNQVYVYPEHRDHDPAAGDTFPANTPYFIVSQGSSGSDQPFVHAISSILAAFQPKTKNVLRQQRMLMPTVQMILRRGQSQIETDEQYMSGPAHPSVFEAKNIDLVAMVEHANRIAPQEVPAVPRLSLIEQDSSALGTDHFAPGFPELMFNTPAAIARVVRSAAYETRLVISAEQSTGPNNRPLTYHWKVLRGDEKRIRITPLKPDASRIELIVPWHERRRVPGRPDLTTDRVDIGLFVNNGSEYSAPALVSFMFPGNQIRKYDDNQRIVSIEYDPKTLEDRYVDPALFPRRAWRDTYSYDDDGKLLGWSRDRQGDVTHYTRHGALILDRDTLGRASRVRKVRYVLAPGADKTPRVVEKPTDEVLVYRYRDDSDLLGSLHAE